MATSITSSPLINSMPLLTSSTTKQESLGERVVSNDGRSYRYALVGALALTPGTLLQGPAEIANHQNLTPSVAALGATQIVVTLGATAVSANQYANGVAILTTGTGAGYTLKINSHASALASATLTLNLSDALVAAIDATTRVDLVANAYNGVIINPAASTSTVVGVAIYPAASGEYAWIQTGGVSAVLADGAIVAGTSLVASNAVAGAVEATASTTQQVVGYAATSIADTEKGAVELCIS